MILGKEFFNRSSVVVAKDLIGKFLVRKIDGKVSKFLIVETEGYGGLNDLASHASRGKTLRNAPMFEEAGTIYVYFTYGMHYMLNIVCGPKNHPSAVLIRGISLTPSPSPKERGTKKVNNLPMSVPSPLYFKEGTKKEINLIGPARLTKHLKINKDLNSKKLGKLTGLWTETSHNESKKSNTSTSSYSGFLMYGKKSKALKIIKTPRIGVNYAGPIWSKKLYRFVLIGFETKKFS